MTGKRFRQDNGAGHSSQPAPYVAGSGRAANGSPTSHAVPAQQGSARAPRFSSEAAGRPAAPRFSNDAAAVRAASGSSAARSPRFSASQAAAPVTSTSGATGAYVAEGSPRPISVDPAATGSFSTIRQGRGAVTTTRENAGRAAEAGRASVARTVRAGQGTRKKPQPSKAPLPVLVGIGVAALVVVVLAVVLLSALISPRAPEGDEAATSVAAETVVAANEGVESGGFTYSLSQGEGGWELVRSSGGQDTSLATLSGEPVCVTLYQGTLFIPENLSDGTWDIICYVLGDGSTTTQLLGSDGNPVTGSGTVQSATVDGSSLVLTGDGVSQSVALE